MEPKKEEELGLAKVLQALGQELRDANQQAETKNVGTLAWTEATVEVALEVKTTAKGGIKFAVWGIGAEGGADRGKGRIIRAQVRCVPAGEPNASGGSIQFGANAMKTGTVVGSDDGKVR